MSTNLVVGSIVEGKVTSIKAFGAFVALNEEKQGLVHISQVKDGFVKDVNEHLSVGDDVKVKILSIDEETKKISLSIREANPQAKEKADKSRKPRRTGGQKGGNNAAFMPQADTTPFNTMEDQLKDWLKDNKV